MSNIISLKSKNDEAIGLLSEVLEKLKSGEIDSIAIAYAGEYTGILQSIGEGDCPFRLIGLTNFLVDELMIDRLDYSE